MVTCSEKEKDSGISIQPAKVSPAAVRAGFTELSGRTPRGTALERSQRGGESQAEFSQGSYHKNKTKRDR